MSANFRNLNRYQALIVALGISLLASSGDSNGDFEATMLDPSSPTTVNYTVTGSLTKRVQFEVDNPERYANISLYTDDKLLIDNLNIPRAGEQILDGLVRFEQPGDVQLTIRAHAANLTLRNLTFEDVEGLDIPSYRDASVNVGLDHALSIKYGGPTIADIDNDGDYDLIVNNHNAESSKLYWNNGDGTVSRHDRNLARWFMQDLHGTAAGDYDNDGDLDLVVTQGGGNGKNPSTANFYQNNDGTLVLFTGDVGIDKGGRGRGAKWSDMDLDGDLDLMLINETGLTVEKPQHFFYRNSGDGRFQSKEVQGLQDQHPSRALITDLNDDNIDDVILFGPLSVWFGNGDFTFKEATSQIPKNIANLAGIMAVADIDIDNDGDLDLYLARGKEFEGGFGEAPSLDHDPLTRELTIKPRGYKGVDAFDFVGKGSIRFHKYYFLSQGAFRGKDYPIFLGREKSAVVLASGEDVDIEPDAAKGWPDKTEENGIYFGYLGDGQWKAKLVRNDDIFWGFKFSLSGVEQVTPGFVPENRNIADVLLRNDNGFFTDVSTEWNIPPGGNTMGVTVGDFNNDSHQDIFAYRWGLIGSKISDYMLLNDGTGQFQKVTMHGASHVGGPGNGDMGQAFDFDLDGDLDLLNGNEGGAWYLYQNEQPGQGNYALVRVGYSPESNVDPISATVTVKTTSNVYRKRVGSAGAIFSQSLLNIVHFGLGAEETIKSINVRWRNGETQTFTDKQANELFAAGNIDYRIAKDAPPLPDGPLTEPFIRITNEDDFRDTPLIVGDDITLNVKYHAGTGNTVISSDEGGIRFWLRHFKSEWFPEKDIVLTDASVLKTESGHSSMTLSLQGLTPTAELPDGHFYLLRASFAASDGSMLDATIYPLEIIAAKEAQ